MSKRKFALIGDGFLAGTIVNAYCQGKMPLYELTAVFGMDQDKMDKLADKAGCGAVNTLDDMLAAEPDIVVEVAAIEAVQQYVIPVLEKGIPFVALSIGAFADEDFYKSAQDTAAAHDTKLYFSSGAIGGFDVIQTIALIGGAETELTLTREISGFRNTGIYQEELFSTGKKELLFDGTAAEAIRLLPRHINIGVAASLSTVGTEKTHIRVYGDPDMPNDDDVTLKVASDKASAEMRFYAKESVLVGWSVVSLLNNLASPVYFY